MHEVRMPQPHNFHSGNKQNIRLCTTPERAELRAVLVPGLQNHPQYTLSCLHINGERIETCLEGLNKMRKGRNSVLLDHQAHLLLNCAGTPLAPKTMLHFFPTGFLKISEESCLL